MCLVKPQPFSTYQKIRNFIVPELGWKIALLDNNQLRSFYTYGNPHRKFNKYQYSSNVFDGYVKYKVGFHVFQNQEDAINWFNKTGKKYLDILKHYQNYNATPILVQVKYKRKHLHGLEDSTTVVVAHKIKFLKQTVVHLS